MKASAVLSLIALAGFTMAAPVIGMCSRSSIPIFLIYPILNIY